MSTTKKKESQGWTRSRALLNLLPPRSLGVIWPDVTKAEEREIEAVLDREFVIHKA